MSLTGRPRHAVVALASLAAIVLGTVSASAGMEVRPGSMGKPTPGFEIALLDQELREMEEGEIAVRVKPVRPLGLFREYWRNENENAPCHR